MKMKAEYCKCCGGVVEFPEGKEAMVCSWCGTWNKLLDERVREREDFKNARELQLRGEFCDAEASYQRVLDDVPDDADALWGRLLCHYGAALVTEEGEQRKYTIRIPRSKPLRAQGDFERACENALPEIRAQYEQDAAYIDTAMARIRELAATKPPYDVFICHKTSNPNGVGYTEDYGRAYDLRNLLVQQGYRVFFAPLEMEGVSAGENYEAGIYHALDTAKVMLVICSDPALVSSTWVASEWQRYLSLRDEGRQVALIPLLYGGMKASALPRAFHVRSLQAIKMELDGKDRLLERLQALIPREKPVEVKPLQPVQPEPVQMPVPAPVQQPAPQQPSTPVQTTGKRGNLVLKWLLLLCAMLAVGIGSVYVYAQMQGAAVRDTAMGQNSAVETGLEAPTEIPTSTPAPLSEETPVPTVAARNVDVKYSCPYRGEKDGFVHELDITWDDIGIEWGFALQDLTENDGKLHQLGDFGWPLYNSGECLVSMGNMAAEHTYVFYIYPKGDAHDGLTSYRFTYTFPPTPTPKPTAPPTPTPKPTASPTPTPELSAVTHYETIDEYVVEVYSDKTCVITGYTGSETHMRIPSSIGGYRVKGIGNSAFADSSFLIEVVFPDTIIEIDANAFYNCDDLASVDIPKNLLRIGHAAFYSCDSLRSVTIPSGVTTIGSNAFAKCLVLGSVTIPSSVSYIGDNAFARPAYDMNSRFTLRVPRNSYAATYAQENSIKCEYTD